MNLIAKKKILVPSMLLCSIFIVFSQGMKPDIFAAWNLTPIFICYFILKHTIRETVIKSLSGLGFLVLGIFPLLLVHAAWLFDWGENKTDLFTSGLIFIFLPAFSIGAGVIGFLIGSFITEFKENKT